MNAAALTFARSNARPRKYTFDPILLMIAGSILLLGLVMMTSASITIADRQVHDPLYYLERQATGVLLGILAAIFAMSIPTNVWERIAIPLLVLAFAFLVIVLIPGVGHEVNGSRRWLRLGVMNFQASELARVLLLTYLASYVVRRQAELKEDIKGFLKPLGILIGAGGLLLLEPDFGAATVLMTTGLGILFIAGVKLRHFIALVALAAAGLALIAVTSAYRLKRLTTFLDPWADPFNSGFQLTQSLIAIGRGELIGVGLGSSVQKLFYLPEAHTDFVFAVLAEELGLAGVILTLALFIALIWRAFHISRLAAEAGLAFQAYCAAAFGMWLGLQTFINIGVNMGILPTKGLTLPLMSYGGSSMLVTLGWLGLLMRIHHEASTAGRLAIRREARSMSRTVLIMAGGTGGHVFPALAAARVLRERGFEPVWLGTQRGLEAKLVPAHHIEVEWISVSGLRGKGIGTWLSAPFKMLLAVWQSLQVMRRRKPAVVLGAGGFVSGPGGVAAWLMHRPLVIHEQNAVAGMTNRLLSRLAQRVLEAFPSSFPPGVHAQQVGNPVRREIAAVTPPSERFADRKGPLRVLVFGGSQGAARLNAVLPAALAMIDAAQRPQVIHQAGDRHIESARALYAKHGVEADVRAFIDDMAEVYAWADLVVCRSGALTVSEIAAVGLSAVFIPFAAAVDDHQTRNAKFLVDANAAILIPEAELTQVRLFEELRNLFASGRTKLADMAARARSLAITDADVRLADACMDVAGGVR